MTNTLQGYYTPSPVSNETSHPAKNVTYCSNPTNTFHFDPASIIQSELGSGISLEDIQWPDAVDDGMRAIKTASKFMLILYCIGIATTGLAFMSACSAVAFSGLLVIAVNGMLSMVCTNPRIVRCIYLTRRLDWIDVFDDCFRNLDNCGLQGGWRYQRARQRYWA